MRRDNFTDFIFNGIASSDMKVIITQADQLKQRFSPSMENKFITPAFADGRYYSGTTISGSTISISCAAIRVTDEERQAILQWLNPYDVGELIFANDYTHYYRVKINNEIKASRIIESGYDNDTCKYYYTYEFTIEFITVDDWCKLGTPANIAIQYEMQPIESETCYYINKESVNDSIINKQNSYNVPYFAAPNTHNYLIPCGTLIEAKNFSSGRLVSFTFLNELDKLEKQTNDNGMTVIVPNVTVNIILTPTDVVFDIISGNFEQIDGKASYRVLFDTLCSVPSIYSTTNCFLTNPGNQANYWTVSGDYTVSMPESAETVNLLTVKQYSDILYQYSAVSDIAGFLNCDSRTGLITSNGQMLRSLRDATTSIIDSATIINNGSAPLESGCPETLYLNSINATQIYSNEGSVNHSEETPIAVLFTITLRQQSTFLHDGYCNFNFYNEPTIGELEYSISTTDKNEIATEKAHYEGCGYVESNGSTIIILAMTTKEWKQDYYAFQYLGISTAIPSTILLGNKNTNIIYSTQTRDI